MKKLIIILIIIAGAIGGFYYYTQSGEVLDEALPEITNEEVLDLMNEEDMGKALPDNPLPEPELNPEMETKIQEMLKKAEDETMTKEEIMAAEKEIVEHMALEVSPEPEVPTSPAPTTPPAIKQTVNRSGQFTEIDLIHKGSGTAHIYPETAQGPILRLQDFSVTRGPDLYVYLSKNKNITSSSQLGEFANLGVLKSSKGNQNYPLPEDYNDYNSVVIWCKAFGVLFSSATLQ